MRLDVGLRLGLGVGRGGHGAYALKRLDQSRLAGAGADVFEVLGQRVERGLAHVLVPDDRVTVGTVGSTARIGGLLGTFTGLRVGQRVGQRLSQDFRLRLLARGQLQTVGLRLGQLQEQILASLEQDPAPPVPDLQPQALGRGAFDDELRERALATLLAEGRQQSLGGELTREDVADGGHAAAFASGRATTHAVNQVLAGLVNGVASLGREHLAQTADVAPLHCAVGVGLQVPLLDQVAEHRVLVVQRSAERLANDVHDVPGTGVVQRDAQCAERIDDTTGIGSHFVDARLGASSPQAIDTGADVVPSLFDVELVGLKPLAVRREDQLHALVPGHDALASHAADDERVSRSRSTTSSVLGPEHRVPTLEKRVASGGQLEHGTAVEVVGHRHHELAVDRVVRILVGAAHDQLVPVPHRVVTCQGAGDRLVDGVAFLVGPRLPGPRIDVLDEEAQHVVHAVEDETLALGLDLAVRKDPTGTVAHDQGEDLRGDALVRLVGVRDHGVTGDDQVHLVLQLDLGRSVGVGLRLATLQHRKDTLAEPLELARPVHGRKERHVRVLGVPQDVARDQIGTLRIRPTFGLGALAGLRDLAVGEHRRQDSCDDVILQGQGPLCLSQRDNGSGLFGCTHCESPPVVGLLLLRPGWPV